MTRRRIAFGLLVFVVAGAAAWWTTRPGAREDVAPAAERPPSAAASEPTLTAGPRPVPEDGQDTAPPSDAPAAVPGPARRVVGRVFDGAGAPVAGAVVWLDTNVPTTAAQAMTGPDGSYAIAAEPGRRTVLARAPGTATDRREVVVPDAAGDHAAPDLVLGRAA
jgi:hypothetical protein